MNKSSRKLARKLQNKIKKKADHLQWVIAQVRRLQRRVEGKSH